MSTWSLCLPIDRRMRRALRAGGSLSARLARTRPDFAVRRLLQAPQAPLPDERRSLRRGDASARRALARDVLLNAAGEPLVFAHSVTAASGLRGPWRALRGLGARPLADLLYADRRVRRAPLHFARLAPADPLARRLSRTLPGVALPLWARRSAFVRGGVPLLVTEVFLPAFWAAGPA